MNYHTLKAVVLGLALVTVSGCSGGGGFFSLFDGSSVTQILAMFDGPGTESEGPFSLFGGDEGLPGVPGGDYSGGDGDQYAGLPQIATVHNPEPMSIGLFGTGLLAMGAARRRKTPRRSTRG